MTCPGENRREQAGAQATQWGRKGHRSRQFFLGGRERFDQHQFRSLGTAQIIRPVEGLPDQVQAQPPGPHHFQRAAIHLAQVGLFAVVAQPAADRAAFTRQRQTHELVVRHPVGVTDHVGASFVDSQHHQVDQRRAAALIGQKLPDEAAHQGQVARMARKFDGAVRHAVTGRQGRSRLEIRKQAASNRLAGENHHGGWIHLRTELPQFAVGWQGLSLADAVPPLLPNCAP